MSHGKSRNHRRGVFRRASHRRIAVPGSAPRANGRSGLTLVELIVAMVIFALIFGAVQLENLIGRILCGAAVLAVVAWLARDLKQKEWRPLALVLIGLAYIVPPLLAIVRDLQH